MRADAVGEKEERERLKGSGRGGECVGRGRRDGESGKERSMNRRVLEEEGSEEVCEVWRGGGRRRKEGSEGMYMNGKV